MKKTLINGHIELNQIPNRKNIYILSLITELGAVTIAAGTKEHCQEAEAKVIAKPICVDACKNKAEQR